MVFGKPPHDLDYVVVGWSVEEMLAQDYQQVGKEFLVFLHPKTKAWICSSSKRDWNWW